MDYPLRPSLPPVVTFAGADPRRSAIARRPAVLPVEPAERITWNGYLLLDGERRPAWQERLRRELARCITVACRTGPDTVVSHTSAALLHGLWVPPADAVHVTHPHHGRGCVDPVDVAPHTRPLDRAMETEDLDGMRVTTLERTVLDCITSLPPDWALAVADSALRREIRPARRPRRVDQDAADALRRRWAAALRRRGAARGVVTAREVLARASALSESPGESRTRAIILAAGFPDPAVQPGVVTARGTVYPDLAVPDRAPDGSTTWVFVEFDGEVKYGAGDGEGAGRLVREKKREDALRERGAVVRVVSDDLTPARRHVLVTRLACHLPHAVAAGLHPVPALVPAPLRRRRR